MKHKAKKAKTNQAETLPVNPPPTVFEQACNIQSGLYGVFGLDLPPSKATQQPPEWIKNIYGKFKATIFKSVLRLKPKGKKMDWRNYGRMIGIAKRYGTFMKNDVPRIMAEDGWDKISDKEWRRIESKLGLKEARKHLLKVLKRPASDPATLEELWAETLNIQLENCKKLEQTANLLLANQDPKSSELFLRGVGEGYVMFLNLEGKFSGDDRRFEVLAELLAMQHEIEKMRRSVPPKYSKHLISRLKELPEFKNKPDDWFKEVFKDIKLSIGTRGRPAHC